MAFVRPRRGIAATAAAASFSVDDFIVCIVVVVVVIVEDGAIEDAKSGKGIHGVVCGGAHPNVAAYADANLLLRRGRRAAQESASENRPSRFRSLLLLPPVRDLRHDRRPDDDVLCQQGRNEDLR